MNHPFRRARRRSPRPHLLLSALAATAAGAVTLLTPAQPAAAASELVLGPSTLEIINSEDFGNSGDVPMPECGSNNIEGSKGFARWTITSSLGTNSVIFPGREWDVTAELYADNLDAKPWLYNDGPDPLVVQMVPAGPVAKVTTEAVLPAGLGVHDSYGGDGAVGPKSSVGSWGYAFDSNSGPKLDGLYQQTSDGVDLSLRFRVRATGPGQITLPKLQISGWDSTPTAAEVACSVALDWSWNVIPTSAPLVVSESANVDASYVPAHADDRNDGGHSIAIDVLANDDNLNTPGGVGDPSQLRISDHSVTSIAGGTVSCGAEPIQLSPTEANFPLLPDGPCIYSPPVGYSGPDSFEYTVRQRSDMKETTGKVSINVRPNPRPVVAEPTIYVSPNTDTELSVAPYQGDPQGDPVTCLPTLVTPPDPTRGNITMHADCTFDWDYVAGNGAVDFTYRVCDTHPLVTAPGTNAVRLDDYASGIQGDLSDTTSRRCTDAPATVYVESFVLLPPIGMTDYEIVDTGYAAEDIGAYTVAIPVLANDIDQNGPAPTEFDILDGPDPSEGTALKVGNVILFTPADEFGGAVQFTYRVCEDPETQDPPYEGFGFCGVGQVVVLVVNNQHPQAKDDWGVAVTGGLTNELDVGANDSEPDLENRICSTTPVAVSDPAKVDSITLNEACMLQVDTSAGSIGELTVTYAVCDDHLLTTPTNPAPIYGADGREPGDPAPRCAQADVVITIIEPLVIDPEGVPEVPDGPTDEFPEEDPGATTTTTTTVPDGAATTTTVVGGGTSTTLPGLLPPSGSPTGELPATGQATGTLLIVATLLVAVGASALLVRRRV